MALFGGKRDVSLFRSLNRELIHRYIDTEVLVYKLNLINTTTNLYGSINTLGSNKLYFNNATAYGEASFASVYGLYFAATTYPTESMATQIIFNGFPYNSGIS